MNGKEKQLARDPGTLAARHPFIAPGAGFLVQGERSCQNGQARSEIRGGKKNDLR
jgi:hypothetical protein